MAIKLRHISSFSNEELRGKVSLYLGELIKRMTTQHNELLEKEVFEGRLSPMDNLIRTNLLQFVDRANSFQDYELELLETLLPLIAKPISDFGRN